MVYSHVELLQRFVLVLTILHISLVESLVSIVCTYRPIHVYTYISNLQLI